MTAPETPSPSPLTLDPPMTVAEVDRLSFLAQADADRWTAYRANIGDDFSKVNVREALEAGLVGASAMALLSFLPHVRALAARVSDLEAREFETTTALRARIATLEQEKAQAVRSLDEASDEVNSLEARLESAHRGLGEWRAKHEDLEVERDGAVKRAGLCLNAKDSWMVRAEKAETVLRALDGKAQEVRRAWDAQAKAQARVDRWGPVMVMQTELDAVRDTAKALKAAIDALCTASVPEKESAP